MKRQGLLSVTGILLLGLVMLMTLHEWDSSETVSDQAVRQAPAILAEGITARAFSEKDGTLEYYLTASHLTQYDHKPRTQLENPELVMANDKGNWDIRGDQGEVQNNGNLIVFTGQVIANNSAQKVQLNTEKLRYNSNQGRVIAPGPVSLQSESGTTQAGAMDADINGGILNLRKGVKSEFNAPAS